MANRYVNCLKEPPVSQLFEKKVDFRMNAFRIVSCREAETGEEVPVSQDGAILAEPGSYILKVRQ